MYCANLLLRKDRGSCVDLVNLKNLLNLDVHLYDCRTILPEFATDIFTFALSKKTGDL